MIRKITEALCASLTLIFNIVLATAPATADDDDDPHAEYHPSGIPTKKNIPTKQAERDRKDKYDNLEMNKWPPDLWPRDDDNKSDKPN